VTNARPAARRRGAAAPARPAATLLRWSRRLRSPPGRPTGEPGPGVAARRRRGADRPQGAGASRAPELRAAMPPRPTFQTRRAPPPRPV